MNDMNITTPSAKIVSRMFLTRVGKICSNLSIILIAVSLLGMVSFIATALIFLFGVVVILLSIGTIFAYVPNFFDYILSGVQYSASVASFFLQYWYAFLPVGIALAAISLVLLATDKNSRHTGRIVISSIVVGIALLSIIVLAVGV